MKNLVLLCEPLAGWRHVTVIDRRTNADFAQQIKDLVDVRDPEAERIVLVMDNLNTPTPASRSATFPPAEAKRLAGTREIYDTPKHGSWLTMAESELSVLSRPCLDRRIRGGVTLVADVAAWEAARHQTGGPIDGRVTTDDVRIKLKRLSPPVQE